MEEVKLNTERQKYYHDADVINVWNKLKKSLVLESKKSSSELLVILNSKGSYDKGLINEIETVFHGVSSLISKIESKVYLRKFKASELAKDMQLIIEEYNENIGCLSEHNLIEKDDVSEKRELIDSLNIRMGNLKDKVCEITELDEELITDTSINIDVWNDLQSEIEEHIDVFDEVDSSLERIESNYDNISDYQNGIN